MGRLACVCVVAGVLFAGGEAHAQFANRSLGLQVGYLDLDEVAGVIDWGVPVGITATGYVDNAFEWTFGLSGMLFTIESAGGVSAGQVLGVAGGPGIRYLFLQESLRPYVGAELTYLHVFFGNLGVDLTANYVGVGPFVGLDYFVLDTLSIGAKAQFNAYVTLTNRLEMQTSKGVFVTASAWF